MSRGGTNFLRLSASPELVTLADMLHDSDGATVGLSLLRPDHFADARCRHIFEAIARLDEARQPIDIATVCAELERSGKLEAIGGRSFVIDVQDLSFTSANTKAHAVLVIEDYTRRTLTEYGRTLANAPGGDILELLAQAQTDLTAIQTAATGLRDDFRPMMDVCIDAAAEVDRLAKGGPVGIGKTGLRNLDDTIGAIRAQDYVIIAGRTSMGKTALATSIAANLARSGVPLAFFSLEMGDVPLVIRMACADAKVSLSGILNGRARPDDVTRVADALQAASTWRILWDKVPAMNPAGLRVKCEKAIRQHGVRAIFLDYVQLMSGPKKAENREKEVAAISRMCKSIARDFGIAFIALSQLKRNGDNRPSLSDLRDSGSLEQDADIVLFPWRDPIRVEYGAQIPTTSPALVEVAKQRNGPRHIDCHCLFHNEAVTFVDQGWEPKP